MKKVLIITDMFPDKFNPVSGIFVRHQVDELTKRYEIRVVATSFPHRREMITSQFSSYEVSYVFYPLLGGFFLSAIPQYRRLAIPIVKQTVESWGPDIIHVHDCRHIPELWLLSRCLTGYLAKKFLTVHNVRTHPGMIADSTFKWFYRITLPSAYSGWNHIFTVNDKLKTTLSAYAGNTPVSVIGNAVSPSPQSDKDIREEYRILTAPGCFNIISAGNLKAEKGFDCLIKAVSELKKNGKSIRLVIVGDGPEKENLSRLISSLDLGNDVLLAGQMENSSLRQIYTLFDAFVLASYSETFGIVYLEAMSAGLPAVGIRGQGIDGVIRHGENGLLARPRDVSDLVAQIRFLMLNKPEAGAMAARGKQLVDQDYQLSGLIERIAGVYEQ